MTKHAGYTLIWTEQINSSGKLSELCIRCVMFLTCMSSSSHYYIVPGQRQANSIGSTADISHTLKKNKSIVTHAAMTIRQNNYSIRLESVAILYDGSIIL